MRELPTLARLYVVLVVAAASVLIANSWLDRPPALLTVGVLMLLQIVGDSLLARGSRDLLSISLGSVTTLAAIPMVGTHGAVLVASTAALAIDRDGTPLIKRLFNGAQLALAAGVSGTTYVLLGGTTSLGVDSFPSVLGPILAADVAHCVANGALVALVVGLHQRVSPIVVWQGTMSRSVLSYLAYGLFGLLLAVLWLPVGIGPAAALLLLLPLFVARWAYAQYAEEQRAYDSTVRALMAAVETKDLYTRGHSERVSAASVLIARTIGMREDRVGSLRYAGMLHDIGKLGVPTRLLQKAGGLTEEEFAAIQRHPEQGLEIVREIDFLDEANAGIRHHHERLDGLGYPMGLRGDDIPEFARVIAVADAFDSMTTTRSYRGARSIEHAITELRRCAGTQFDPRMVEALVRGVAEHGWAPDAPTPLGTRQVTPDEVFDQELAELDRLAGIDEIDGIAYAQLDHDDPTAVLVREQS